MKQKLLMVLMALLLPTIASAKKIGEQEALRIAQDFMKEKSFSINSLSRRSNSSTAAANQGYYVFNDNKNGGFVIVSADDRAQAILGYSDTGLFDYDNLPDNAKAWMDGYAKQISALDNQEEVAAARMGSAQLTKEVAPLLGEIAWNQMDPYNLLCPFNDKSGQHYLTGCGPTAMAQIMYYYRWPQGYGKGSTSYYDEGCHQTLSADFSKSKYDWDKMLPVYGSHYEYQDGKRVSVDDFTDEQANEVAKLMRDCGFAAGAHYAGDGTSSGAGGVCNALKTYFDYKETTCLLESNYYDKESWESIIRNELDNNRPVLYSATIDAGGHIFICDGYDINGFFHFNWGWGGGSNGYYATGAMRGCDRGNIYCGIQRSIDTGEQIISPRADSDFKWSSGNKFSCGLAVWTSVNNIEISIAAENLTTGAIQYLSVTPFSEVVSSDGTWINELTMKETPANGNYKVYPVARASGKNWEKFHFEQLKNYQEYVELIVSGGVKTFSNDVDKTKYLYNNVWYSLDKTTHEAKATRYIGGGRNGRYTESSLTISPSITYNGESYIVSAIDEDAFSYCTSLTTISIPSSVREIGPSAFYSCTSLTNISLEGNITTVGPYAFYGCTALASATFGDKITSIGHYAFYNCTSLESAILPDGLTTIEQRTFFKCKSLSEVVIPATVTSIGKFALYTESQNLRVTSLITNPFSYDEQSTIYPLNYLIVPKGTKEKYKATEYWSWFKTIVEEGSSSDAVTLTAKSYSRVYGDANPTFEYMVTNGTITSGAPTITCSATATSPVGTYDIIIAKGTVSNSNVELVKGTLTITKAPLTISAGNYTKKEGEENPAFKATYSGFKNNETEAVLTKKPTITTTATKTSPTGSYPVTVSGAEAQNYAITYQNGTLTVTASGTPSPNAEPYAVLSNDNSVVTFFYDNNKVSRGGIDINNSWIGRSDSSPYGTAKKAVFDASFASYRPISTSYWFHKCSSMTTISGIENLKTDNVTDMGGMFAGCSSLTNLDVSGFKTDKVTIMYDLFSGCSSLTSLDVSGFNTSNVTSMSSMFYGCTSLTNLDVSGFNTSNVTSMRAMFYKLYGLSSLDLSSFKTDKVEDMSFMFYWSSGIETIYVGSEWSTAAVKEGKSMFEDCRKLVGGQGTAYRNAYKDDYTYAHIDGGTANPGYLTDIKAKTEKVTLTAKSYSRIYGDPNPTFEYTVTGGTITSGAPTITCSATATSPVGTYDIVIAKGTVSNSNVELVKGTLTITKAPLTISAGNYTKVEGEDNPTFTPTYSGFKNGETEAVLTKKPIVTCEANKDSEPGSYEIKVSGAKAQNYDISYVSGWLTIEENPNKFEEDDTSYEILDDETVAITKDWKVQSTQVLPTIVLYDGKSYTVTVIGADAFRNNQNLTQITIPNTITSIGDGAFAGCVNLTVIIIHVENPIDIAKARTRAGGSSVFEGVDKETCILYVPDGSVEAYKTTDGWNEFKNILPISALGIDGVYMNGKPFDIYTLQGRKVRHEATSLDGLPKGVYIINGRKVVK